MLFRSAVGGTFYIWPRVTGRSLYSFKMGNWSFWLMTIGISLMGIVLTAQGLQQGFMLGNGVEWVDSLVAMKPYWLVRTLAGITMDLGMTLVVVNLTLTALGRGEVAAAVAAKEAA